MRHMAATTKADPFEYGRLYGNEKYSLNNMTVRQLRWPRRVAEDKCSSVWSDLIYDEWRKAREGIESNSSGDAWWNGVSDDDFVRFAQAVAKAIGCSFVPSAARIVRYTDGGGYPVYRLDVAGS